jgi:hypothetical protein
MGRAPRGEHRVDTRTQPADQRSRVPGLRTRIASCRQRLAQIGRVPHEVGAALIVEVVAHRPVLVPRAHGQEARARATQERRGRETVVRDRAIEKRREPVVAGSTQEHGFAAEAPHAESDICRRASRDRAVGLRILTGHEVDDALTQDRDHRGIHGAEPTEAGPAGRRSRPCRAPAA